MWAVVPPSAACILARMFRALLVDYGGVVTTSVLASFGAFCEAESIDVEVFKQVMLGAARTPDSPFARVERGEIEQDEFDRRVARMLTDACGREVEAAGLKQRLFARVVPDEAMATAIRAVRDTGVTTVLVSNSWGGRDYPQPLLEQLFDHILISGAIGMRKPDAEIYLHAAAVARAEASACVFIDDFAVNVEGAEAVGMTGILHREAGETVPRLGALFGLDLTADAQRGRG